MNSKTMGKLFGILVLGGVSIAQAQETPTFIEDDVICQVAVVQTIYQMGEDPKDVKTCIDEKSDAEVAKIIEDARAESCSTPFCGCWLG